MHPLETYLSELRTIRSSGAGVKEASYYGTLANLLNEVGKSLKPKVKAIIQLQNSGAGLPDGGFFTPDQFQKASEKEPLLGQTPSRGVIEVKGTADELKDVVKTAQIEKYLNRYGLLLITNYRDFLLLRRGSNGKPTLLEGFQLAPNEAGFWSAAATTRKTADALGQRFIEYLKRGMLHAAPLNAPEDVAFFLASYARDARARVDSVADLPAQLIIGVHSWFLDFGLFSSFADYAFVIPRSGVLFDKRDLILGIRLEAPPIRDTSAA